MHKQSPVLVNNLKFPQIIVQKKIDSMKASKSLYLLWNGYYLYSEENQIVILNDQYNNSETRYLHLIILVWRCYWVFDWWTKNNVSTCICINKLNKAYLYTHWRYNFWYSVFKLKNTRIIIFLKKQTCMYCVLRYRQKWLKWNIYVNWSPNTRTYT